MGNSAVKPAHDGKSINGSRVLLLDDDWRNQTKESKSYEVYKYIDFKGGGSLVEFFVEGDQEKVQLSLTESDIAQNLVGQNGCGIFTKLSQFTPHQLLPNKALSVS